jgi:hypothetical protein
MRRSWFCFALVFLTLALLGCGSAEPSSTPAFPVDKPALDVPAAFTLDSPDEVFRGEKVNIDGDVADARFEDCEVWVISDDVTVVSTEFRNSQVFVAERSNVTFDGVIFRDLDRYERAALNVSDSSGVSVRNCQFLNNYIGLGVHSSSAEVIRNRFEENNGHNALVIGEGSSVQVSENYFYGSFPHAMLIMNREASPQARVEISRNVIDQTGEDAIDFEDYRNASPSTVSDNVVTNTGWSAIIVEYNSWQANVTIEGNWIEGTGIDWELPTHDLQPDSFQLGWGHGILVEDSSLVMVAGNRIMSAAENGIEVRNGRDVTLQDNGIDCSGVGIGVYRYGDYALHREFSPVAEEDAGGSQVLAVDNVIYSAADDYDVDEFSELTVR